MFPVEEGKENGVLVSHFHPNLIFVIMDVVHPMCKLQAFLLNIWELRLTDNDKHSAYYNV